MTVSVRRYVNGPLRQNCYILADAEDDALIVDPGSEPDVIAGILDEQGWQARAIVNTHGHFDHVGAVADLMARFDLPFYLHGGDEPMLRRANLYALVFGSREAISIPEMIFDLRELTAPLEIGLFNIDWLETPGHTPGSVCYRIGDWLFTGDTVLPGSVGDMKLPGADPTALANSLDALEALPPDLLMHPGHGRPVPLGEGLKRVRRRQAV